MEVANSPQCNLNGSSVVQWFSDLRDVMCFHGELLLRKKISPIVEVFIQRSKHVETSSKFYVYNFGKFLCMTCSHVVS